MHLKRMMNFKIIVVFLHWNVKLQAFTSCSLVYHTQSWFLTPTATLLWFPHSVRVHLFRVFLPFIHSATRDVQLIHSDNLCLCCQLYGHVDSLAHCCDKIIDRKQQKWGVYSSSQLSVHSPPWWGRHGRGGSLVAGVYGDLLAYISTGWQAEDPPGPNSPLPSARRHSLKAPQPRQHHHLEIKCSNTWTCGDISHLNHNTYCGDLNEVSPLSKAHMFACLVPRCELFGKD